jgi:hypothetical protein
LHESGGWNAAAPPKIIDRRKGTVGSCADDGGGVEIGKVPHTDSQKLLSRLIIDKKEFVVEKMDLLD